MCKVLLEVMKTDKDSDYLVNIVEHLENLESEYWTLLCGAKKGLKLSKP